MVGVSLFSRSSVISCCGFVLIWVCFVHVHRLGLLLPGGWLFGGLWVVLVKSKVYTVIM